MKNLVIVFFLAAFSLCAAEPLQNAFILDGISVPEPAFSDKKDLNGNEFDESTLFSAGIKTDNYLAIKHKSPFKFGGRELFWNSAVADEGKFYFEKPSKDYELNYLAFYLDSKEWQKATLKVNTNTRARLYIDGVNKGAANKPSPEGKIEVKDLILEKGKHFALLEILIHTDDSLAPVISAEFSKDDKFAELGLEFTVNSTRSLTINDIIDARQIRGASISEGGIITIGYSELSEITGKWENWTDIYEPFLSVPLSLKHTDYSSIVIRDADEDNFKMFFLLQKDGKTSIGALDTNYSNSAIIKENIEDFTGYRVSDDGKFIIYSVNEKSDKKEKPLKKHEELPDRWPGWRNRSHLYYLDVESGASRRLTYGNLTASLQDISPDGSKILFAISEPDYTQRPYSKQSMFVMDLADNSVDTLWKGRFYGVSAQFSPDGRQLLCTGGPSAFDGAGENVPEGITPNNYDNQAYIYDISTGKVNPITKNFNPEIGSADWVNASTIYFTATDSSTVRIFKYIIPEDNFIPVDVLVENAGGFSVSSKTGKMVYWGNDVNSPVRLYYRDNSGSDDVIFDEYSEYPEVLIADKTSDNWDFVSSAGKKIKGRVYYPPGFDEDKKYPLIVNYYGGTSPITRSFGGRYPLNLYAAMGYIVYVLQPSGATGFGQEFSALHVNNWGKTVAGEIIEGTQKFLEAHPFADSEKVGCIGASYGGFMTQLLLTRTDLFAAGISHAGISSISSYWGEGFWGYLYSAEATANSFPWNSPGLYVDQSPLFAADKINTPLLLLHGSSDTNVPVGESIQMYTALKLLGREVELIEIADTDHWVVQREHRIKWNDTIFAWFDKWLKGLPHRWNEMYGE